MSDTPEQRPRAAGSALTRRSLLAMLGAGAAVACTTTEHITITLDEDRSAFGLRSTSSSARRSPEFTGPLDANRIDALPSLVPGEVPEAEERAAPLTFSSDRLDLDAAEIVAVGVDENGHFEVPDRLQIGWYRFGPTPGGVGSSVLAAHVALNGQEGLFRHLDQFAVGDVVDVAFDDTTTAAFAVQGVAQYNKDVVPLDDLFERSGPPRLILITCGGAFNPQLNSFDDNLIAFATPVV